MINTLVSPAQHALPCAFQAALMGILCSFSPVPCDIKIFPSLPGLSMSLRYNRNHSRIRDHKRLHFSQEINVIFPREQLVDELEAGGQQSWTVGD